MGFLAEFDSTQSEDAKIGVVLRWLRSDWRTMYAELRSGRPVLKTTAFTIVTRATDVLDILSQPSLYSVRANQRTMDPSVGPFMLARDETEINWEEKGLLHALMRWDDLPRVRQLAGDVAAAALNEAEGGTIDLVPAIARRVPLRIVQHIFGFNAPDQTILRWSFATQHGMFRNLPFSQDVLSRCHAAGEEMRAWLWPFLAAKWAAAPSGGDDTISRLVDLSRSPAAGISVERVLSNVCGLLVGAIETMSQAIVQVVDQMLAQPEWLAAALAADARDDVAEFDAHVFEALRFNPITTIQFRFVEVDRQIGCGAPYASTVRAGTTLAVCTGSAMFDPALMPDPDRFDSTRPQQSYLHFGTGHHECLGRHVGQVAIPEAVRQVLRMPAIKRAAGAAGVIDFNKGPFPEHMVIEWRTSASDAMLTEGVPA